LKRVFAVVIVGILLVSLVGCGSLGNEKNYTGKNTSSIQNVQSADSETVKTNPTQNTPNVNAIPKSSQPVQNSQGIDEISNQFNNLDFDGSLNTNDQVTEKDLEIPNP
jgi:uncharacterized lipoprotein YehR (DUF1307 family)